MTASILIVDNEPHFLRLMRLALSKEGYTVTAVESVDAALIELERGRFAIAIVDIRIPPTDGIELLLEIKKRCPSTRVIMTTGYPTEDVKYDCMSQGASAYLPKPFDLAELKAKLRELAEVAL